MGLAYFAEDAGGHHVQRPARRPFHGNADPDAAGRSHQPAPMPRTAIRKHIMLFPEDPERMFRRSARPAFDLADRLQTPIFVMTRSGYRHERAADRDPLRMGRRSQRMDRGKLLSQCGGAGSRCAISAATCRRRCATGFGPRTIPGNPSRRSGAYVTRGIEQAMRAMRATPRRARITSRTWSGCRRKWRDGSRSSFRLPFAAMPAATPTRMGGDLFRIDQRRPWARRPMLLEARGASSARPAADAERFRSADSRSPSSSTTHETGLRHRAKPRRVSSGCC